MITADVNSLPFKLSSQPIEYKRLQPNHFPWANGKTPYEIIEPDNETGYVTDRLFETLSKDFNNSNTCIVNIGVGRGKTKAALRVIDYYASKKDYVVILASPFKKLVHRDYTELKKMNGDYKVVNYEVLENEDERIYELASAKVHVITINSLMFNPGEDNLHIIQRKRDYCNAIQQHCRDHKKKVVFVFDEIHAGIHCFQEEFIFNLRAWKDVTHKCFVLSATYTEPARVAIEYIAYLTNYRLYIAETTRTKFPRQSNLHLYITDGKYSVRDLSLLDPLIEIVSDAIDNKLRVHIVTAFKELADKLVDPDDKDNALIQIIRQLDPNLVTGESNFEFCETASNIGTTFYTGIDLKQEEDILVLIMPSADSQFADRIGGIFTTGKVAISQAIARLRTQGDIHVFMPKPDINIEGDYRDELAKEVFAKEKEEHVNDERQFKLLSDFYTTQRNHIENEIVKAQAEINGQPWEGRAPLNYPSLASFILNKGMNYLIQRHASFGKGFSPYVLWAAMNDQFENTTLKSLNFVLYKTEDVHLVKSDIEGWLLNYYGWKPAINDFIEGKDFTKSYNSLFKRLAYKGHPESAYGNKIKLFLDGKYIPILNTPPKVRQAIVNILYWAANGGKVQQVKVDSSLWVRSQIAKYQNKKNWALELEEESIWYKKLEVTRRKFVARVKANDMVASAKLFDPEFLFECYQAVKGVNRRDKLLHNRTFTFCRLVGAEISEKKEIALTKKHILAGGTKINNLRNKIFQAYKSNFTVSTFLKKKEAKVESFQPIPEKHFYPDIYRDPNRKQSKIANKSGGIKFTLSKTELSSMSREALETEEKKNNKKLIENSAMNMEDLIKLLERQKAIQDLLGIT